MTATTFTPLSSSPILPSITTASTTPSIYTLVIDDNVITGRILAKILEKEFGHKVVCLKSGEEALEALSQQVVDICFLDIDMPGLNGIETALAIRRRQQQQQSSGIGSKILEPNRSVPIIAYTTNEWSQQFIDCGINGFLPKPASLQTLRSELERIF